MRVEVRNNNVDKAIRNLKKKLTEEGMFNELREREFYETKGQRKRKAKNAAKRRVQRDLKKRMENEGYLTKQDNDFIQDVWDLTAEMKPLAQQSHKNIFGYYFKEIEATPFTNRFGTYKGGYVPAKTDP